MQRLQGDATRGLWPTEMGKTQGEIRVGAGWVGSVRLWGLRGGAGVTGSVNALVPSRSSALHASRLLTPGFLVGPGQGYLEGASHGRTGSLGCGPRAGIETV